jgi:N-acetylmuramate 1-kinase
MSDYSKDQHLNKWIEQWVSKNRITSPLRAQLLAGDGSQRSFYRLTWSAGARNSCVLLSDVAWDLSKDYPAHQAYLQSKGMPVPRFLEISPSDGILVMEDLGDLHLQSRLLVEPKNKMQWLAKATELLASLHGVTYPVPKELPVATRSFDKEKYLQELSFTIQHLHVGYLNLPELAKNQLSKVADFCASISQVRPLIFSHRDYHCRNLMLHQEKLFLIDFQDARLGPPQYDLASLIYDAYIPISPDERASLIELYRKGLKNYPVDREIDWSTFEKSLKEVALQRVVKAAGSFASFFTRYGKKTHLPYLVPSLQYAIELAGSDRGDIFPLQTWLERVKEKEKAK